MNVKGFRYKLVPMKFLSVRFGIRFFFMIAALWILQTSVVEAGVSMATGAAVWTKEQEDALGKMVDGLKVKHTDAVKQMVEEALKSYLTIDQLTKQLTEVGADKEAIKKLADAIKEQGEALKKLSVTANKPDAQKSLDDLITEHADKIKALAGTEGKAFQFTISRKAVLKALVDRGDVANSTQALRLAGVGQLPYLGSVMSGLFRHAPVGSDSNGAIRYVDQAAIVRGAGMVAEGAQKPESSITWTEKLLQIKKIADTIPVTQEAWNDVTFIKGEIERLLEINLDLKEDSQLWSGDGLNENLKGIYTTAGNITATASWAGFANTIAEANVYDLIATGRVCIMNSKQSKYNPQTVVMNPADILIMKLSKGVDGHYILPPFIAGNGQSVDGMKVIESSQVTQNTMVIGDFRYGTVYDLEDVVVKVGYVGNQFIENKMTILAEKREALLVRDVDADAFVKITDIGAAVTAITKAA